METPARRDAGAERSETASGVRAAVAERAHEAAPSSIVLRRTAGVVVVERLLVLLCTASTVAESPSVSAVSRAGGARALARAAAAAAARAAPRAAAPLAEARAPPRWRGARGEEG